MTTTSILWRRLDQSGHDAARLHDDAARPTLEGTAVFSEAGRICRLDYRVMCDREWRTVTASVRGWIDTDAFEVDIAADAGGHWSINGRSCPAVLGCIDVDLSFTPVTNLLPIRRLGLAVGARAAVRAAWLNFPNVTLEPLDQVYERIAASRYRYESSGGSFKATLETSGAGLVTSYEGLWQAESQSR